MLNNNNNKGGALSRRSFLGKSAALAAGIAIVPRHVLGGVGYKAPSDTLNIAGVGIGGMGRNNLAALGATENIVALCDIDDQYAGKAYAQWPNAKRYKDFRVMLEQQKDIDAVVVATPDHTHAVVAIPAMELGKHVYVQKPLTWSVQEARALAKKAEETKVVTQMGNQGHSSEGARLINEYIWGGYIGDVTEVHVWTNRPIWPQGVDRPTETMAVPATLDWDLFLGPAPERPYHSAYTPFRWRGWMDFGTGAIGDMGAHLIDHPYWALKLGLPLTVETTTTRWNKDSFPLASITYYEFGPRENMPPVKLIWYDGGLLPPRPEEFEPGEKVSPEGGVMYFGTKGKLIHETYGSNPRLLPKSLHEQIGKPKQLLPRVETSHEMNWANAIKGIGEPVSPFSYAAPLTETMLLGVVAMRAGTKISYDGANMRVTNVPEANAFLGREYRSGWKL